MAPDCGAAEVSMPRSLVALFLLLIPCIPAVFAQVRVARVRVSEAIMQGLLIKKIDPERPGDAHVRGEVALKAQIDKNGNIEHLELISGHPLLVPAAIDAVRQWKYKPYVLNGTAVAVETTIRVAFLVNGKDP